MDPSLLDDRTTKILLEVHFYYFPSAWYKIFSLFLPQRERKSMEKYIDEKVLDVLAGMQLFGFKSQENSKPKSESG